MNTTVLLNLTVSLQFELRSLPYHLIPIHNSNQELVDIILYTVQGHKGSLVILLIVLY